jgi:hypothetical protein
VGEFTPSPLLLDFDARVRLEFRGATLTSGAGLLVFRELDDALGRCGRDNAMRTCDQKEPQNRSTGERCAQVPGWTCRISSQAFVRPRSGTRSGVETARQIPTSSRRAPQGTTPPCGRELAEPHGGFRLKEPPSKKGSPSCRSRRCPFDVLIEAGFEGFEPHGNPALISTRVGDITMRVMMLIKANEEYEAG